MKKILILLFILISQNSFSQKLKVYGIVSDEEATLSGVSVVIKGTKIGVDTDKNGYFEIEVNKGAILQFSYLGYKTEEIEIGSEIEVHLILISEEFLHNDASRTIWNLIELGVSSGLQNTERGLLLNYQNESFFGFSKAYKIQLNYQYGTSNNKQLLAKLNFSKYFFTDNFSNDLNFIYNIIDLKNQNFSFDSFIIENEFLFYPIKRKFTKIYSGIGVMKLNRKESTVGYEFGLGQKVFNFFDVYSKAIYWSNRWQLKSGFNLFHKRFTFSYNYNTFNVYNEHNLGITYTFLLI